MVRGSVKKKGKGAPWARPVQKEEKKKDGGKRSASFQGGSARAEGGKVREGERGNPLKEPGLLLQRLSRPRRRRKGKIFSDYQK